ncbi:hypothetical protein ACFSC4_01860 [Deinococcus malanensis]|uniref:putative ABC transporter permease subunit n=1 Tax=Deinococcus malanensis TaxID=1706855 RepID=UPI00363CF8EB
MTGQSLTPASLLHLKATALGHALQGASRPGLLVLVSLGILLLWGEVYSSWRALTFLGRFGDIGTNVFARVLEIGLITLCSGVTFSATTAAIQTLYLSDDLNFLLTQPLPTWRVFALKVFETFLNTALVPVFLILPLIFTVGAFSGTRLGICGDGPGCFPDLCGPRGAGRSAGRAAYARGPGRPCA